MCACVRVRIYACLHARTCVCVGGAVLLNIGRKSVVAADFDLEKAEQVKAAIKLLAQVCLCVCVCACVRVCVCACERECVHDFEFLYGFDLDKVE